MGDGGSPAPAYQRCFRETVWLVSHLFTHGGSVCYFQRPPLWTTGSLATGWPEGYMSNILVWDLYPSARFQPRICLKRIGAVLRPSEPFRQRVVRNRIYGLAGHLAGGTPSDGHRLLVPGPLFPPSGHPYCFADDDPSFLDGSIPPPEQKEHEETGDQHKYSPILSHHPSHHLFGTRQPPTTTNVARCPAWLQFPCVSSLRKRTGGALGHTPWVDCLSV